jgi:hypothetical protein
MIAQQKEYQMRVSEMKNGDAGVIGEEEIVAEGDTVSVYRVLVIRQDFTRDKLMDERAKAESAANEIDRLLGHFEEIK